MASSSLRSSKRSSAEAETRSSADEVLPRAFYGRDTLVVAHASSAPTLDGKLDDAAWAAARPVRVRTDQGANLGGAGVSTVEIRAVEDGKKIYFAFTWDDPTRSEMRLPLIKREDGWRMLGTKADIADVTDYYEDKLAILSRPDHPDHDEVATWMGEDFDPAAFDLAETNASLTSLAPAPR